MDWWLLWACVCLGFITCCCSAVTCDTCASGTRPAQLQIEWDGVLENAGSCPECLGMNTDTYVLDWAGFASASCNNVWEMNSGLFCGYVQLQAMFSALSHNVVASTRDYGFVSVGLEGSGITCQANGPTYYTGSGEDASCCDDPPDCSLFAAETITGWVDPTSPFSGLPVGPCLFGGATAYITSVP